MQRIGRYSQWQAAPLWLRLYTLKIGCTISGSQLRNQWLKTTHKWLNSSAIFNISMNRMLDALADIKQVINIYEKKGKNRKTQKTFSLSQCSPEAKKIMETLELEKYQLEG